MKQLKDYIAMRLQQLNRISGHNKNILLDVKQSHQDRASASEKFISSSSMIYELEKIMDLVKKEEDAIRKKANSDAVNFGTAVHETVEKIILDNNTNHVFNNSSETIMVYPNFGEPITMEPGEQKLFGVPKITPQPPTKGLCVDVGTKGNPGVCEYRGIDIETRKVVFHVHIPGISTNNIGELLAVVEGYKYAADKGKDYFVYSDSQVAISWARQKKCKTNFHVSDIQQIKMINEAEGYLRGYKGNSVQLWSTKLFGQIYADFNRKK